MTAAYVDEKFTCNVLRARALGAKHHCEVFRMKYFGDPQAAFCDEMQAAHVPYGMRCHLEAATLNELRLLLPMGLTRLDRSPGDESAIVETWL
jgi:hypothetical protein